jgi:hypothetical protein
MLKPVSKAPPFRGESIGISSRLHTGFDPYNRPHSHRVADSQLTREWLADGAPIADVLTMLEVRRRFDYSPHFARAYAVEIVWAVWQENHTTNHSPNAHRKEPAYAVA